VTQRLFLRRVGLLALFLMGAPDLPAQDAGRVIERFERAYRSRQTLEANFVELYWESGKQVRAEAGVAYFGRPGRMRWEYRSPENNLYVIDGKWEWFYVPADHTATRIKAKESSDWRTPLALLAGKMKVSRICGRVRLDSLAPPSRPGNSMLRCELRGNPQDSRGQNGPRASEEDQVLFEVDPANGELARIIVSDPGGVQVEFRFSNWRFDPRLDGKMFRFEPPKGVAIVDGDFAVPRGVAEENRGPAAKGRQGEAPYTPGNGQPFLASLHIF
jgi:outer membrane lipoprotein carrier protein